MADRSVIVRLGMEVAGYQSSAAKAAASTAAIGKEAQKAAQVQAAASAKAVSEVKKLGVATVGVAAAIGYGMAKAVGAASDLYETINKSNVVFGTSAAAVQKWGKTAASAMGMSENTAISAAATLGNLFVSMGQSKEAAAGMSMQMVQLASDLASFNNTTPEDALEAIRAGLVGEVEPLRRYGVALQDATLKQEAMNLGYSWTGQVLPPLIRQQAAYSLILKQTGTAQGDFARTSDGLANQQRILSAQFEDMQANLGSGLLPVVTKMVSVMNDMLEVFNELPSPVQATAIGVVALGGATLILAPRVHATVKAVREMSTAMGGGGLLGNLKSTAAFMVGPWGVALVAGTGLLISLANQVAKTKANVEAMEEVLKGAADANETYLEILDKGPAIAERFAGGLNAFQSVRSVTEILADMGVTIDQIGSHLNDNQQGWDNYANGLVNAARAAGANGGEIVLLQDRLGDLYRASNDAKSAVDAEGKVMGPAAAAARDLAQANKESADAAKAVTDAINAQISAVMAAANADLAAMDAQDNWKASLKDSSATLRDKERAALEAATAVGQAAAKEAEAAGAADGAAAGNAAMRAEFEKMRAQVAPSSPLYKYLTGLIAKLDEAAIDRSMTFTTNFVSTGNPAVGMTASTYNQQVPRYKKYAAGGLVTGPGTSTSDSVLAYLSAGEYVVGAAAVQKLGVAFLNAINGESASSIGRATVAGLTMGSLVASGIAEGIGAARTKVTDAFTTLLSNLRSSAEQMANQIALTLAGSLGDWRTTSSSASPGTIYLYRGAGGELKSTTTAPPQTKTTTSILASQQDKAAALEAFQADIARLVDMGLNASNLEDIIAMGAKDGVKAAEEIISGGQSMVDALNAVQTRIDAAAKAIGQTGATAEYGPDIVSALTEMVDLLQQIAGKEAAAKAAAAAPAIASSYSKTPTVAMPFAMAGFNRVWNGTSWTYVSSSAASTYSKTPTEPIIAAVAGYDRVWNGTAWTLIPHKAGGGLVTGPGSATSDSILTRLSAGEYVLRASAVKQIGVAALDQANSGRLTMLTANPRQTNQSAERRQEVTRLHRADLDYMSDRVGERVAGALNGVASSAQRRARTQTGGGHR